MQNQLCVPLFFKMLPFYYISYTYIIILDVNAY